MGLAEVIIWTMEAVMENHIKYIKLATVLNSIWTY